MREKTAVKVKNEINVNLMLIRILYYSKIKIELNSI